MPKKKKVAKKKTKKTDIKTYNGIKYEVDTTGDKIEYLVLSGQIIKPFTIDGTTKRALTVQIKKEIDVRLEIVNRKKDIVEPETVDIGISEEDESDIFDFDSYSLDDEPDELTPSEKAVVEALSEANGSPMEAEGISSEESLTEGSTASKTGGNKKVTPSKDIPDDITESETIEKPSDPTEKEDLEIDDGSEKSEKDIEVDDTVIPRAKRPTDDYPKTEPMELSLSLVVNNGQLFGVVGYRTYVTIKNNSFIPIQSSKFSEAVRGKTLRVMPLKIKNTLTNDLDANLTFRFLLFNNVYQLGNRQGFFYSLAKGKGSLWIVPEDNIYHNPLMDFKQGTFLSSDRSIGLCAKRASEGFIPNRQTIVKTTYPRPDMYRFNNIEGCEYFKDTIKRVRDVMGSRPHTDYRPE